MTYTKLLNDSNEEIYSLEADNATILDHFYTNTSNSTFKNVTLDPQVIGVGLFLALFILVAIIGNILVILSVVVND